MATVNYNEVTVGPASGKEGIESDATIAPGLRADLMRKQMESKNTLRNKGDLYIGTGESDPDTGVCQTQALEMGEQGFLCVQKDGDGSKVDYYQPFEYDPDNHVMTITWYAPEENGGN